MMAIFFILGVILAGYSGFTGLPWHLIFVSSALVAIGYLFARFPQIMAMASRDGFLTWPKLFATQVFFFSVITAPIYFAAGFFS